MGPIWWFEHETGPCQLETRRVSHAGIRRWSKDVLLEHMFLYFSIRVGVRQIDAGIYHALPNYRLEIH
jgi:hypothetical protein